ncbi:MAG: tetratricopeptide repeat protein [Bacteroidetes bacterium]|nr:tetratricopeptide repeat protein [Bacteroidota bacterium]
MKRSTLLLTFSIGTLLFAGCKSGLVTMTNGCYNALKAAAAANDAGDYSNALNQYNQVLSQCKAYDAKEQAYAGKAEALNGLQQYNDALAAANAGLIVSSTSVENMFQKASAELGLGMNAEAKADFSKVIDMTTKNRNVQDRATIYGKIAELDLRQKMYSDAMNNVQTAITLDNTNADFYILKGDIYLAQNDYTNAMSAYDASITAGGNSTKAWGAKIEAEAKAYQQKYGTGSNANDLASKMSASDKSSFCTDITTAKNNGVKSQSIDLLQLAICK